MSKYMPRIRVCLGLYTEFTIFTDRLCFEFDIVSSVDRHEIMIWKEKTVSLFLLSTVSSIKLGNQF